MKNLKLVAPVAERHWPASACDSYLDAFRPREHVPPQLVSRAAEKIVPPLLRALAEQNITAHVTHDLSLVANIQRNSDGRMRLVKANDPAFHPNASPANANVLVLMRDGVPVGCVASRLIWCERTLGEEMESGRFWVAHPQTMWNHSDRCINTSYMAKIIKACPVVYIGSIFLALEVTGGNTLAAMLRLHYLWLVTHWQWSWAVGLVEGALIRRHAFDVYGVMSLEIGVWRTRGADDGLHRYQMTLMEREASIEAWLRPEMGDLSREMGRPPRSVLPDDNNSSNVATLGDRS